MLRKVAVIAIVLAILSPQFGFAGYVKIKSKGSAPATGFFGGLTDKDKAKAIMDAKRKAIQKYSSQFDSARLKIFEPLMDKIMANVDEYIPESEILGIEENKASNRYEVILEVSIDESRIEKLLRENTTENAVAARRGKAPVALTFIFVARETKSVREFQDRVTNKVVTETSGKASEAQEVSEDGQGIKGNYAKTDEASVTRGGSTLKQADQVQYNDVSRVSEIDSKVNEVFAKGDIQVSDPADVGIDVEAMKIQFATGSDISGDVRKSTIESCRKAGLDLFAVGTMDTGLPGKDQVTGLIRVSVSVTAKITDLRRKIPVTVASVGPVHYAGLGPNAEDAKRNALIESATKATKDLVDQLRAKGLN